MDYIVKTGAGHMIPGDVASLLHNTYWAYDRPEDAIRRSMERSDCYGVFTADGSKQVAFARVITDGVTTFYLCDVVVDPALRGQGVGTLLLRAVHDNPAYAGLLGLLATRDAQDFYRRFGYEEGGPSLMRKGRKYTAPSAQAKENKDGKI
ncbi:MAG: GNAT family N-acetyltransferase [Oscillospiraceae bacterium]|nr:GNAT family N-acetyltransferase [Oscillospiraceae bacterium]